MIIFRIPPDDLPLPKEKPFASNLAKGFSKFGSSGRTRTCDHSVNSRTLYQLSYRGTTFLVSGRFFFQMIIAGLTGFFKNR
jgi:hypothetical protein